MTRRGRWTLLGISLLVFYGVWSLAMTGVPAPPKPGLEVPFVAAPPPKDFIPVAGERTVVHNMPLLSEVPFLEQEFPPPVSKAAVHALQIREGRYEKSVTIHGESVQLRYTMDPELTNSIWKVLQRGRVSLGHVLVMDAETGEIYAYLSTSPTDFSPHRTYPAASLVKVVTAAAALEKFPAMANEKCRYAGNPYRLHRKNLNPPAKGHFATLPRALAMSNNHCFARWAINRVGADGLLAALDRFGLLRSPALGHPPGMAQVPDEDPLELGRLGSGLSGLQITPLHAVQLAAVLTHGLRVEPHWIAQEFSGTEAATTENQRVLSSGLARQLRKMLVETTRRGTARRAFRTRSGRPLLQGVQVAGKTGSLSGNDPDGRYEWFIGVAPADAPRIAVATLAVQGDLYWMSASQLAAEVLKVTFCPQGVCRDNAPDRFMRPFLKTAQQKSQ